jgi:hypothetical protein
VKGREEKTSRRRRSQAEKVGRLKYIIRCLRRLERKIDRVDAAIRMILAGLRDFMSFESSYIEDVACENELDRQILHVLVEKGEGGVVALGDRGAPPHRPLEGEQVREEDEPKAAKGARSGCG